MSQSETISPIRKLSIQSRVAESVPKIEQVAVENSFEAEINSEYISDLVEMYRVADKNVFIDANKEGRKSFKKLKDIEREIYLVLDHEGLDKQKLKEVINRLHLEIHQLNTLKSNTQDPQEQVQIINQVAAKYHELLAGVTAFMQIEKVEDERHEEVLPAEEEEELNEVFEAEKERILEVKKYIETNNLGIQFLYDLDRVDSSIAAIESILTSDDYSADKKEKKFKTALVFLRELRAGIERRIDSSVKPTDAVEMLKSNLSEFDSKKANGGEINSPQAVDVPKNEYKELQPETLEALSLLKEINEAYLNRLIEYYENLSLISSANFDSQHTLGLKPVLPIDIQQLQAKYIAARDYYFLKLASENEISSDISKYALGTKFVIDPYKELLNTQEVLLSDENVRQRLGRLLEVASRYPTLAQSIGISAVTDKNFEPIRKPEIEPKIEQEEALSIATGTNKVEIASEAEIVFAVESLPSDSLNLEAEHNIKDEAEEEVMQRPYLVKNGDTFWTIVEEQFAEDLQALPARKKMEILDALFERVQANSELKDSLGIRSGDIDLIYAGEEINLTGIESELDKILYGEEVLANHKKAAQLKVEADNETKTILMKFVSKNNPEKVEAEVASVDSKPADKAPQKSIQNSLSKPSKTDPLPTVEKAPLTPPKPHAIAGNYFNQPEYINFVEGAFGSEKAILRMVDKAVDGIDNSTYDIFNRGMYDSPYYFMNEMTLEDIDEFQNLPNSEVRYILQTNNIKYDTYLAWLDKVDELKALMPHEPNTTLADIFSRYIAESQISRPNILTKKV